jgi:hypothetical protein
MSDRKISDTTKILHKAKELLKDKNNWCQGIEHRVVMASVCFPSAIRYAHQYCLVGAIRKVSDYEYKANEEFNFFNSRIMAYTKIMDAANKLFGQRLKHLGGDRIPESNVPGFNDHRDTKHEDVVAVLDEAIRESVAEDNS